MARAMRAFLRYASVGVLAGVLLAGAQAAPPDKALPFTLRPGDVLANAPLGVRRDVQTTRELPVYSATLGVLRTPPPAPAVQRSAYSSGIAVLRGAGVEQLAPSRVSLGAVDQRITLSGYGLTAATTLRIEPAEGIEPGALDVASDGATVEVDLTVQPEAAAGVRQFRLLDAQGRAIPVLRAEAGQLLIAADPPVIESIAPSLLRPGESATLLIRGRHLRGLPLAKSDPNQPIVRIEPPDGIAVGSAPTYNEAGTEVSVPILLAADAAPGARRVEVETLSGVSDANLTPANTLTIIDEAYTVRGPWASPLLGVQRGSPAPPVERLAFSSPAGVVRGPYIGAMQPDSVGLGSALTLRLEGRGLSGVSALRILPEDGITLLGDSLQVAADAVQIDIQVAADAPLAARRVELQLDDRVLRAPTLLSVRDAEPVLSALRPSYLLRNGSNQTIDLQGTALSQTTAVSLEPDSGLIIESYEVLSATAARMVLRAAPDSVPGARVVRVRSPSATSGAEPTPGNTLYLRDPAQIIQPLASPLLGVRRGGDSTPPREAGGVAPLLGVLRGEHARILTPTLARRGVTTRLRVEGRGLQGVSEVAIEADEGLTLAALAVDPDGRFLEVDLNVAADAQPGARRLRLRRDDGSELAFAPLAAGQLQIADNSAEVPEGWADRYTLFANAPLEVGVPEGVLANDFDPAGGELLAVLRSLPAAGTLNLRADGSFVYTPAADRVGSERFEYSPANAQAVGNATQVTLVVSERDDAFDDTYLTPDNRALEVSAAQGLLANDRIHAGASNVSVQLDTQPSLGSIDIADDGSFRYLPSGAPGSDSFRYRLLVDGLRSLPATVVISVQDINDAPIANDDAYVTDRGALLQVNAAQGVLANDSDADGDTLQARVIAQPAQGALSMALDGSFSYQPPSDFVGHAQFRYEAFDARGGRAEADVTITVNDTLAAADDAYVMNEGEVLFVDEVQGVLANDSVFPQGTLRVVLVEAPTLGQVELADDGSFVYTLPDTDVSGVDAFRYRLEDDRAASPSARVQITVRGVNDAPIGEPDRYITDENAELIVAAPGVLGNDRDIEGDILDASLASPPAHGQLTLRADGSFTYVPEVNFRGSDSFEYIPGDGSDPGQPVRVDLLVTQPPTATNDVYLVDVDTPIEISDPEEGLLFNDHDAPENDPLIALIDSYPQNGDLQLNEDGTFSYAPDAGYSGLDVWTYQVSDGRSESNVGTVTMAVGITSLPRAVPDEYEGLEDTDLVVSAAEGVLANDLDADTPREQLEAAVVGYDGRHLSITLNPDGSFIARPRNGFVGETFFVYQVYDGRDISNGARVTLRFAPVNDGVEAVDDHYGVRRNTVLDTQSGGHRSIRYNDRYDPSFDVAFEMVEAPTAGTASIDAGSGRLIYTPGQDFAGTDRLRYRVYQVDTGIEDFAEVSFRINAPPVAVDDVYTTTEDQLITLASSPLANDYDVDGDALSLVYGHMHTGWYFTQVQITVDDLAAPTVTELRTSGNYYGTALIRYWITDGTDRDEGEITVEVAPVPDNPVAAADSYLTLRDTPLSISSSAQGVLRNDFDPDTRPYSGAAPWPAAAGADLQPLKAELVQSVQNGTLNLYESGTFYYVPSPGFSGVDRFRYRNRDATGRASNEVEVSIRVNSPAVAVDDAYVATEDVPLVVAADAGLLTNDTDIDGDPLRASRASNGCAPCNGQVQVNHDGSFRYTPNRDFHGEDEFFYTVRDGINGSDVGRVSITVLPVNDPPITDDDTYRTREDEVLVAPEPQGVLRNDREVDGDGLDYAELIEPASHGSVAFEPNGAFTYTPDPDFNGEDGFRYRVYDTTGLYTDERVEVFVTPVNDPPSAAEDRYSTRMDQELVVAAAEGVLANDSDVDGPSLRAGLVGPPQHGQLSLQPDGSFRYRPNGFFSGVDQFRYQVDDGLGALATGTALIQVTAVDPEVEVTAEDDFYRFPGPRVEIAAPGVIGNDRIEGAGRETLRVELAVEPDVGSVALAEDGSFVYQAPDGFAGLAGFTYTLRSGDASAIARVSLDVQSTANVPPQARGESYGVLEDGLLDSRQTFGLLANDSDHEGDPLELEVVAEVEHGDLQWLGGGHFLYRPAPDFHGSERIRYRVSDGRASSVEVEATISVFAQNDAPVAADDVYRVQQDVELQVAVEEGVLANDTDVDGDALIVELVDEPEKGQLLMDPAGGFRYRPLPGQSGEDSFRYAASDLLALDTASVRLNITRSNAPPLAQPDRYRIDEDSVLDSRVQGSPLANDSDPDGDALSLRVIESPQLGSLRREGPHLVYTPQRDVHGEDGFSYVASDGEFDSAEVQVVIEIAAVNDPPETATDLYTVARDGVLEVAAGEGVLANDFDVEGDALQADLDQPPSHGSLDLRADGGFVYRPRAGFAGRDEFAYRAADAEDASPGRVVIDVLRGGNARPLARGERFEIAEDTVLDTRQFTSLLANDSDPDGGSLELVAKSVPRHGSVEWLPGGHLRYTPLRDHVDTVRIRYAVSDGELESEEVSVEIVFLAQNDPPQARPDVYYLAPAASLLQVAPAAGVLANDRDPDGDTLVATLLQAPTEGQLKLRLDGGFDYLPPAPRPGQVRFRYRASDALGEGADAEVLLLMDPQQAPQRIFTHGFESGTP